MNITAILDASLTITALAFFAYFFVPLLELWRRELRSGRDGGIRRMGLPSRPSPIPPPERPRGLVDIAGAQPTGTIRMGSVPPRDTLPGPRSGSASKPAPDPATVDDETYYVASYLETMWPRWMTPVVLGVVATLFAVGLARYLGWY